MSSIGAAEIIVIIVMFGGSFVLLGGGIFALVWLIKRSTKKMREPNDQGNTGSDNR